jgi:hypothetical protein
MSGTQIILNTTRLALTVWAYCAVRPWNMNATLGYHPQKIFLGFRMPLDCHLHCTCQGPRKASTRSNWREKSALRAAELCLGCVEACAVCKIWFIHAYMRVCCICLCYYVANTLETQSYTHTYTMWCLWTCAHVNVLQRTRESNYWASWS